MISEQARDLLAAFLAHQTRLSGAAENTAEAYAVDLRDFLSFMTEHKGALQGSAAMAGVTTSDMRAWMAHTRSTGTGARSLARKLSAVKSFYKWLAPREGLSQPPS